MFAFEHSQRQNIFNQPHGLDSNAQAPYPGLEMDSYDSFDSISQFHPLPFSYFENPAMFVSAPPQPIKHEMTRSTSASSVQQYPQHHHEMPPALISSHSIPSASSSTVGSPYSGTISQDFTHESSQGLGLYPTIVNHEGYSQEFVGEGDLSIDKLSGNFVGECADLSSSQKRSSTVHVISSQPPLPVASPKLPNTDNTPSSSAFVTRSSSLPAIVTPQPTLQSVFKSPKTPASAYLRTPSTTSPVETRPAKASPSHASHPMQQYASPFQNNFFAQSSGSFMPPIESSYPSLISAPRPFGDVSFPELPMFPQQIPSYSNMSPATSPAPSPQYPAYSRTQFSPPITNDNYTQQAYYSRRPSVASYASGGSQASPSSDYEDGENKGRCTYPDCGKVFKDLKAHMLTHQSERPEKCPILNCEYNQKGFARKYDKNRHTLTHYKGTMVCGFCPGSGSAAEKSFNRADVFKRHLTSVHGVEQTPPNSRKRSPTASTRQLSSYCQDATGKCSTCSATFNNAQDFYEHLDDCVLRVVQQEEPSEAINAQHLSSIASDQGVQDTLERHMIKTEDVSASYDEEDDEDDEEDEDDDPSFSSRSGKGCIKTNKSSNSSRAVLAGGISKSNKPGKKGMTWSKGGVALVGKGRKKRKHYPPSWGMSAEKMQMKKRVLCVYDGERRLWKDDMMLHNEFEVRMKLPDGNGYVTDLDVETLKRAEAFHHATEAERGPWMQQDDGMQGFDLNELMGVN